MQIIPAVDVLAGHVVRLLKGDYDAVTDYSADPVATAEMWIEGGAELVHVVDLEGARSGDPDRALWRALGDAAVPFQVGGGIRTKGDIDGALEAGARRVVLGSAAVWEPDVVAAAVDRHGPERVVAAIDVRHGRATGSGWLDEGKTLADVVAALGDCGVVWAMATAISQDGTLAGPDLELIRRVVELAPTLKIIGSGGVGTLDDLIEMREAGAVAAIVGKALYEGRFSVADARRALA